MPPLQVYSFARECASAMAKLFFILCCLSAGCSIWAKPNPFFFNIQKSYVSQPSQTNSQTSVSQSTDFGLGGIISKWITLSQIFTDKLLGTTTQRPRASQRPVIQIDPIYVPVDLEKEEGSKSTTEVPADKIETSTRRKSTTTTTTSSYEYSTPSTTDRTTTTPGYEPSTTTTTDRITTTSRYEPSTTSTTDRITTSTSYEFSTTSTTDRTTTETATYRPTTYRPITFRPPTSTTERTTSTTQSETGEEDMTNEIIKSTSTTTQGPNEGDQVTEEGYPQPYRYPPPTANRFSAESASALPANAIFSNSRSPNLVSPNAQPFLSVSSRFDVSDNLGQVEESQSADVGTGGIDPRVFYFY